MVRIFFMRDDDSMKKSETRSVDIEFPIYVHISIRKVTVILLLAFRNFPFSALLKFASFLMDYFHSSKVQTRLRKRLWRTFMMKTGGPEIMMQRGRNDDGAIKSGFSDLLSPFSY